MMQLLMVDHRYHPCSTPDAMRYQDDMLADSTEKLLTSLTECMLAKLCDYEGDNLIIVDDEKWSMEDFFLMDDLKMDVLRLATKVWASKRCAYNQTQVWVNINLGFAKMTKMSTLDQFRYLKDNSPEVACYLYWALVTKPRKAYAILHQPEAQLWADTFWMGSR